AERTLDQDQIKLLTLGAHYLKVFDVDFATVDYLAWGALQLGDWGVLGQHAAAYALEAGVQSKPDVPLRPWFRLGFNRASGDDVNNDDKHKTFFQLLPTPRIYARFPFYNLMNTEDAFVSLLLRPAATLSVRVDARSLRLSSAQDFWYGGGGAFEKQTFGYAGRPSNGHRDLSSVYDISADYRPSAHLTVSGYFGLADGGDVVRAIYPADSNASFGYLEVEWRR
ncbi:MAG TPA: alginate export family protein, partial [Longimicrobiales bacterium]